MGQGTESSETCAGDRPTEVSVIRFVSRNRTIEEIAPKKEVYVCKEQGCGKIFTNVDDYKTHEALESLKIRFTCREPGCGEEVPDPGSMWRHYQEWHNEDVNVLSCPYTNCSTVHASNEILEEHMETCHRHLPSIPTEPEIICFEGSENVINEDINKVSEEGSSYDNIRSTIKEAADSGLVRTNEYSTSNETVGIKQGEYNIKEENRIGSSKTQLKEEYAMEQSKLRAALSHNDYSKNNETLNRVGAKFPKNKDLLITKENFFVKYEARSPVCNSESVQIDSSQDINNTVFINNDVSLTKNTNQEHRIELRNMEKVFRNGFQRDSVKSEETVTETKNNCSDDEEYTPKKQRMSRSKQEPYKCEINGCGKTYKYISHYRHHQDSHKLMTNSINNANSTKTQKSKQGKSSITFFLCKIAGCGAQLSNVTTLWKHYQENHASSKPPTSIAKSTEVYRCKITGCEMEFATSFMLYKHFNEVHSKNSLNNSSTNIKTVNGSGVLVEQTFHNDTTTQRGNFKTDLKAKHSLSLNEYADSKDKNIQSSIAKEESGD